MIDFKRKKDIQYIQDAVAMLNELRKEVSKLMLLPKDDLYTRYVEGPYGSLPLGDFIRHYANTEMSNVAHNMYSKYWKLGFLFYGAEKLMVQSLDGRSVEFDAWYEDFKVWRERYKEHFGLV